MGTQTKICVFFFFTLCILIFSTSCQANESGGSVPSVDKLPVPIRAALFPGQWAYGTDEAYLIKDSAVPVTFLFSGDRSTLKYPITFEVQVPTAVNLYTNWPMTKTDTSNGNKYIIKLSENDIVNKLYLRETLSPPACIELWAEAKQIVKNAKLQWKLSFAGFKGPEQSAALVIKPPVLDGPLPERFSVLFVWGLNNEVPQSIWDKAYSIYRKAGINTYLARGSLPKSGTWKDYCVKRFREKGCRVLLDIPESYAEEHAFKILGTENCWECSIADGGVKTLSKLDGGYTASWADKVDGFYWDFESSGGQISPHKETRVLFARNKGITDSELTPEIIETKYKAEYEKFCDNLISKVPEVWAEFVRQYKPDAPLFLCHGDHMDAALYKNISNMTHQPMIYTGTAKSFIQAFEDISNYVTKDTWPFAWNGLIKADERHYVSMSPKVIRMNMLAVAALGGTGLGHWPDFHRSMDGLYLWEMARATHEISQVEQFFINGNQIYQTVDVAGLPESETKIDINGKTVTIQYPDWKENLISRSFQRYNERLITILNIDSDKAAYVDISAYIKSPSNGYKVYDVISGKLFVKSNNDKTWNSKELREGFVIKVEPMDAVFLRIGLEDRVCWDGETNVADIRSEYLALKAKSESTGAGGILKKDGFEITWDDIDSDGNLEVLLSSPAQKVWITSSGGRVWGWKVKSRNRDLIRSGGFFGAGMDLFWMPKVVRWNTGESNPYKVVKRTITDGKASVTLEKSIQTRSIPGLLISKTYSIDAKNPAIEVDMKFTSQSSDPQISFGFWSHNSFDMGNKEKLVCPGADGKVFIEPDGTVRSISVSSSALSAQQKKNADEIDPASIKDFGSTTARWVATFAADTKEAVVVTLDHEALLQIYKWQPWSSDKLDTLEWMYRTVYLHPQQSWETKIVWEYKDNFSPTIAASQR